METLENTYSQLAVQLEPVADQSLFQIVVILIAAIVVQRLVRQHISRLVKRAVRSHKYESKTVERQREKTLVGILGTATAVIIWVVAAILVMAALEVNIAALATGAGLIGVVVGFGAQSTIKDFLAGIFIIAENQYRVGDIVEISGKAGVVEDITIRITRLRDLDGFVHIIPNGTIDTVTNMTFQYANVNVNVGVAYDSDVDKVVKVINEVGENMASKGKFKDDILEPIEFLRVDSFDESAVTLKAIGKVAPGKQWDIAGEFRRQIKTAFEENGVTIPLPQRVVHMTSDKKRS